MKKLIYILGMLFFALNTQAQTSILWQQSHGDVELEEHVVRMLKINNNYLMLHVVLHAPYSNVYPDSYCGEPLYLPTSQQPNDLPMLTCLDSKGEFRWQRCLHTEWEEYNNAICSPVFVDMVHVENSPYLYLTGWDYYPGPANIGLREPMVYKIDTLGNLVWKKMFGPMPPSLGIGMPFTTQYGLATPDGGLIYTTHIMDGGGDVSTYYGMYDAWVVKLSPDGDIEWETTLGTEVDYNTYKGGEFPSALFYNRQGQLVVAINALLGVGGNLSSTPYPDNDFTHGDAVLVTLDPITGEKLSEIIWGGSKEDEISGMKILDNNRGMIYYGFSGSNDYMLEERPGSLQEPDDAWLVRTDTANNVLWSKAYGSQGIDDFTAVFPTQDGGFMCMGNVRGIGADAYGNPPNHGEDPWLVRVDSEGELLWQQPLAGTDWARELLVAGVIREDENTYTIGSTMAGGPCGSCGSVNTTNWVEENGYDLWLVRVKDTTQYEGIESYTTPMLLCKLYPNPAAGFVNIEIPQSQVSSQTQLRLIDMQGKCLKNIAVSHWHSTLDISDIAAGLYMVEIRNGIWAEHHKISIE